MSELKPVLTGLVWFVYSYSYSYYFIFSVVLFFLCFYLFLLPLTGGSSAAERSKALYTG